MRVSIAAMLLAYEELGDLNSSRVVVYFHGFPGSRIEPEIAAPTARELGVKILSVDRPGFGDSPYDPEHSISNFPARLSATLRDRGVDRFSVLGVSGGVPYAISAMAAFADRIDRAALVSGMAPLAGLSLQGMVWPNRVLFYCARYCFPLALVNLGVLGTAWRIWPYLSYRWYQAFFSERDRILLHKREIALVLGRNSRAALSSGVRGALREFRNLSKDWGVDFGTVTVPTDIWHGTDDAYVPFTFAEHLQKRIKGATLTPLSGAGHLAVVEYIEPILRGLTEKSGPHSPKTT